MEYNEKDRKLISPDRLLRLCNICSRSTLTTYLGRQEFNHIKRRLIKKYTFYEGVGKKDIKRLKLLAHRRGLTDYQKAVLSERLAELDVH